LFDEVFVCGLGKAFTFFLVEVDVVYPERRIEGGLGCPCEGRSRAIVAYGEVLELYEFEVYAYFVVLEGDEGDTETIVSAVEEVEGYIYYVFIVSVGEVSVGGYVTLHVSIATFLAYLVGEFIPDVEPVTVLFVDLGATDFEVVVVDDGVAYVGYPRPLVTSTGITATEGGAEVHLGYYIGITG